MENIIFHPRSLPFWRADELGGRGRDKKQKLCIDTHGMENIYYDFDTDVDWLRY